MRETDKGGYVGGDFLKNSVIKFILWFSIIIIGGITVYILLPFLFLPSVPLGLNASAGNASVVLTWEPSRGAISYNIKRSMISGGPFSTIASAKPPYADNSVSNGSTYYYVVTAVNSRGESPNLRQVSATPVYPPSPLSQLIIASVSNQSVELVWVGRVPEATSFKIKRATSSGGPYTTIGSSSVPIYTDNTVSKNTTYYYAVSAVNSGGESPDVVASATTGSTPTEPFGLDASDRDDSVLLTWNMATGVDSYNIKRATSSEGPYLLIDTCSTSSYFDHSVTKGITYYYKVSAVNSGGESPAAEVSVKAGMPPEIPFALRAAVKNDSVELNWGMGSNTTSFKIKKSIISGGPYTIIGSSNMPSYIDNAVNKGTTYYYAVSAINSDGESPDVTVSATP